MSDNKKYYYLKLKENFFDSDNMVLLESMQDGILYSNILMKMYLKSLKNNGMLILNDAIPYNTQMIATVTRHQVGTVEKALKVFEQLGLIDILDGGAIYMSDIELFVGKSSTEGDRKRAERMKLKQAENLALGQMSDIHPPELEIEKEKEIDIELEIKREGEIKPGQTNRAPFGRYKNVFLSEKELAELQTELPGKWEYYIDRLSGYIASSGKKYKNHAATIRRWAADDEAKKSPKQKIPDYSYREGESL